MPPRSRRPARRLARPPAASRIDGGADGGSPEWSPLGAPAGAGADVAFPPPVLTLSARTPAEAAHGTLRDALRGLGRAPGGGAADLEDSAGERGYERVYAAADAYARVLRRDGVGLPAALVAVRATVAGDAAWLPAAAHATVLRDTAQCCLEAFYAH